uniref:ARAD1D48114p n=1 Tax=Blastobotrys adeninivorans TaxID=409370 RepID=A0A060TE06_BLAAD
MHTLTWILEHSSRNPQIKADTVRNAKMAAESYAQEKDTPFVHVQSIRAILKQRLLVENGQEFDTLVTKLADVQHRVRDAKLVASVGLRRQKQAYVEALERQRHQMLETALRIELVAQLKETQSKMENEPFAQIGKIDALLRLCGRSVCSLSKEGKELGSLINQIGLLISTVDAMDGDRNRTRQLYVVVSNLISYLQDPDEHALVHNLDQEFDSYVSNLTRICSYLVVHGAIKDKGLVYLSDQPMISTNIATLTSS